MMEKTRRRFAAMDPRKEQLLRCAAKLYSLGFELDDAKAGIRKLVEAGTDNYAPEMARAVSKYTTLKRQWEALEYEFLKLRQEILES